MTLTELRPGDRAVVSELHTDAVISGRLMELGLIPGELVEIIRHAPFGDPVEYRIRGVRISMRRAEASCISVVPPDQASA